MVLCYAQTILSVRLPVVVMFYEQNGAASDIMKFYFNLHSEKRLSGEINGKRWN